LYEHYKNFRVKCNICISEIQYTHFPDPDQCESYFRRIRRDANKVIRAKGKLDPQEKTTRTSKLRTTIRIDFESMCKQCVRRTTRLEDAEFYALFEKFEQRKNSRFWLEMRQMGLGQGIIMKQASTKRVIKVLKD
jgi:hypothetical protein